jgi:hypothetical protein
MQLLPQQGKSKKKYPDPSLLPLSDFLPFSTPLPKPTGKGIKNIQSIGVNLLGHREGLGRVESLKKNPL